MFLIFLHTTFPCLPAHNPPFLYEPRHACHLFCGRADYWDIPFDEVMGCTVRKVDRFYDDIDVICRREGIFDADGILLESEADRF